MTFTQDGSAMMTQQALFDFVVRIIALKGLHLLRSLPAEWEIMLDMDALLRAITFQPMLSPGMEESKDTSERQSATAWPLGPTVLQSTPEGTVTLVFICFQRVLIPSCFAEKELFARREDIERKNTELANRMGQYIPLTAPRVYKRRQAAAAAAAAEEEDEEEVGSEHDNDREAHGRLG